MSSSINLWWAPDKITCPPKQECFTDTSKQNVNNQWKQSLNNNLWTCTAWEYNICHFRDEKEPHQCMTTIDFPPFYH